MKLVHALQTIRDAAFHYSNLCFDDMTITLREDQHWSLYHRLKEELLRDYCYDKGNYSLDFTAFGIHFVINGEQKPMHISASHWGLFGV